ncbi:restriction endonuclease subunit S [Shewanella sp. N2AIL]|uniref:restriction endonuclease subunit S n=1 Tax=unclassified Shewanella TaxID=196818 RepID=UPI001CF3975C|nr:restriction endonuclease subunit S [Shewanella sp. SR1]MCB2384050.1 restriction endonuclease subunit S [Shewanella sp. SR1]MCI2963733.1 restriction endonuclease subunit S [Shewanella sp. N2AIL]
MSWPLVTLASIAEIVTGNTPSKADDSFFGGDIPFVTPGELDLGFVDNAKQTLTEKGAKVSRLIPSNSVMVCCIGSLGKVGISSRPVVTNQQINSLVINEEVALPLYVYYFCKTLKNTLNDMAPKTTVAIVNKSKFSALKIPLPPLETQKHIAAVLKKADQLRNDCQLLEQELNSLAQSVFIDMFGDPVTNPKGWACPKLSSIVREIQSGQSPKCDSRPANNGEWGVLKLSSVTGGFYKPSENKAILEGTNPDPNIEVHAGDLLFTRKNTYELVGACAYVRDSTKRLMLPDLIFRFDMPSDLKIYFWGLLNNKNFRLQIKNLASGAAGSMPNISKSRLNDLDVLIPSMDMISKYTSTVSNIWQQLDILSELKLSYGNNFDALMQKAFSGELNLANAKT